MTVKPKITAIAPWFGSNRMLAHEVGAELAGCKWVGVPFAGGMTEVVAIDARTINVNDKHSHVMNLASVTACPVLGPKMYRILRRIPFHPGVLDNAQDWCKHIGAFPDGYKGDRDRLHWAVNYFIAAWMPRHGSSGTKTEFNAGISTRWNASGGDSAAHYQGAIRSINAWRKVLRRCNFTSLDFREFLAKCKDEPGIGIYCDPPFPGPGDRYAETMTDDDHYALMSMLRGFRNARVVIRYYDVPLVQDLYPEDRWTWRRLKGRDQANNGEKPEVLIINGSSNAQQHT